MTLSWADKKMLSQTRMVKAREFLEDAKGNFREGRVKTSINRSYYALLSAARSILILYGANTETHEGAVTMLSLKFVKTRHSNCFFPEGPMRITVISIPPMQPMPKRPFVWRPGRWKRSND
jgi:hypothetical protein